MSNPHTAYIKKNVYHFINFLQTRRQNRFHKQTSGNLVKLNTTAANVTKWILKKLLTREVGNKNYRKNFHNTKYFIHHFPYITEFLLSVVIKYFVSSK